jgi:hypothetical protein
MVDLDKRKHAQHDVKFDDTSRYDLLITASNKGFRLSEQAAHALIRNLKTKYWIRPYEEAIDDDWTEVYCHADATSHEIFTPGGFASEGPVFQEVAIYFGSEPSLLEYGSETVRAFFYIEFRGCLFREPLGTFRKVFKDILKIRCEDRCRPHTSLPPHREATKFEDDGGED